MNIEVATLILNTADLTTTQTQTGIKNTANTQQTWNNINLKDVMGQQMYEKYDTFNIILVENIMTVLTAGTTFATNNEKVNMLMMSGLNFRNGCYSTVTKTQTSSVCIGFLMGTSMSTTVGVGQQYFNNYNTFGKHTMTTDLTISMMKVNNGLLATTSAGSLPDQSFLFKIYGIPN
jgi:hypothetical protein